MNVFVWDNVCVCLWTLIVPTLLMIGQLSFYEKEVHLSLTVVTLNSFTLLSSTAV